MIIRKSPPEQKDETIETAPAYSAPKGFFPWSMDPQEDSMAGKRVRTEEFTISGDQLVAKIKEIIHGGNVRRITIKNAEGDTLIEVPLTLGVVGAVLLPVWAALGAIAALVARLRIVVEKLDDNPEEGPPQPEQNEA